jgi:broad specificity phosphatase PhoE
METIILVRHGETDTNVKGVLHAVKDEEVLNKEGKRQMEKVAGDLKQFSPTKIYTSNEKRTIESGEVIGNILNIPTETMEEIGERNWGDFVGQPWSEVEKVLNPMNIEERYSYIPFNGESWKAFEARLIKVINKIVEENKNQTTVIVSHGGVIRALMPYLLGKPKKESFKYDPRNASTTIFNYENGKFSQLI